MATGDVAGAGLGFGSGSNCGAGAIVSGFGIAQGEAGGADCSGLIAACGAGVTGSAVTGGKVRGTDDGVTTTGSGLTGTNDADGDGVNCSGAGTRASRWGAAAAVPG